MATRMQVVLRLILLCLVAAAIMKVVLQASSKKHNKWGKVLSVGGRRFWKTNALNNMKQTSQENQQMLEIAETGGKEIQKHVPTPKHNALDQAKDPLRIVHLDLKGAAPQIKYLEQIFPLLSAFGANGILLEYEDMFPYEGDLKVLSSPHAYSLEDIKKIRSLAKLSKLEVIPLVQVFGHLEFVLKHKNFTQLREVTMFPNSLNPLVPGARALVVEMAAQVLSKHPETRWFHIGADEVFGLGESQESKNWLHANNGNIGKLFLDHVTAVGHAIMEKQQGIQLLMWDDMMRTSNVEDIKKSNLPSIASPVIWNYLPDFNPEQIKHLISKYQNAGFKSVWFASAFKGASGIDQVWTPVERHLKNHLVWLKVIASMSKYPSISFQGIVLTGWQRYEHFTALCELLPVAIPSLAVCMQALKYNGNMNKVRAETNHILGCNIQLEKGICEGSGAFPGSELYHMIYYIHTNLQQETVNMMKNFKGVFTRYHRKYNFGNPRNLGFSIGKLKKLLQAWEAYLKNFRIHMEDTYFADTVEEWMEENVNQHLDHLISTVEDVERIIALSGRPKSAKALL
ncbi:hypothetical protein Z043_108696 [Scleropages formosus]|uniref:beta-N-acetylhexosaminidase n=2 Tax=Scleropages formosus TaxID=113540 RepID=A0A0P7XBJ1_SCLFO|nr:hexosaminidase D-like [Scleropages formosus]XP_029110100.1 hexosaminidase D-like [Scleropages formosus]KPP72315.1 hypothetical protein Z043_108696 [Scleropages formosus]